MKDIPIFKYRCLAMIVGIFVVAFIVGLIKRFVG
jgi:hypothetical protein